MKVVVQKPSEKRMLNKGNFLTDRLRGFWILDGSGIVVNLAKPNHLTRMTIGTPKAVLSPWGLAQDFAADADRFDVADTVDSQLRISALPITLIAAVRVDTVGGIVFATNHASAGSYSGIVLGATTTTFSQYGDNTGTASSDRRNSAGAISIVSGTWYVIGVSVRGPTDASHYVDGVVDTGVTFSGTGGAMVLAGRPASINGDQTNSQGFDGQVAWIGIWARSLSTQEHQQMARNPFQILTKESVPLLEIPPPPVPAAPFPPLAKSMAALLRR